MSWRNNRSPNSDVDSDNSCPEIEFRTNGRALTIEYDYENSNIESQLSDYACTARQVYFNLTFPSADNYSDNKRIKNEIADIVKIFNDDFINLSTVEVTFRLERKHLGQLACALPFRNIYNQGATFNYYIDGQYQGRVPVNSLWFGELEDEYISDNYSRYSGSNCDEDEDEAFDSKSDDEEDEDGAYDYNSDDDWD